MQSEKRDTLEYYFRSFNKKPCNNKQEIESNTVILSSLSTSEIQDLIFLARYPAIKLQLTVF